MAYKHYWLIKLETNDGSLLWLQNPGDFDGSVSWADTKFEAWCTENVNEIRRIYACLSEFATADIKARLLIEEHAIFD